MVHFITIGVVHLKPMEEVEERRDNKSRVERGA